jgi:hypothetical protein
MPDSYAIVKALNNADFEALTLWNTAQGWQANLQRERGGGWNVCIAPRPGDAIAACLSVPEIPPPPC